MTPPLVTVLINNYNYARYVGTAIDSALAQTYAPIEVIVVDDGSSDDSAKVISSYGDSIIAIYKSNGGQASAFNVGFERSRGEIVAFLDADDVLLHETVERVVGAFLDRPETGMVQSRAEVVDEEGVPLGVFVPAAHVRMPMGDLRLRLHDHINSSWWSPTSGLAISSEILKKVLPLPEDSYRISADYPLCRASALCAPIVSLEEIGVHYRSHGSNRYNLASLDIETLQAKQRSLIESHRHLHTFATSVGVEGYPSDPDAIPNALFLTDTMVALKLDSTTKTAGARSLAAVAWQGSKAALRRHDVAFAIKLMHVVWFLVMLVAPRGVARQLAEKSLFPQNRRFLSKVIERMAPARHHPRRARSHERPA